MTGLLGAFAEAWDEVRVHKSRVVLSLVGVFLAVFAMTSVTAIGQIVAQVQQEQAERFGGRPATLSIQAYDPMTGMPPDPAEWDAAVAALLERYDITTAATGLRGGPVPAARRRDATQVRRVSPSFGPLHRVEPIEGRWFREGDRASLSPALVVNEAFLRARSGWRTCPAGRPWSSAARPRAGDDRGGGARGLRRGAGGLPRGQVGRAGHLRSGREPHERLLGRAPRAGAVGATGAGGRGAGDRPDDLRLSLDGVQVTAAGWTTRAPRRSSDPAPGDPWGGHRGPRPRRARRPQHRPGHRPAADPGDRGAAELRRDLRADFSAVMLESVCATALAGVAAVAASIVLVRNLPLESWLGGGIPLADAPGFPVAAAVEGMIAATAVGALAGLLPAIIAVRAKVIDAIRF